MNRNANDYQLNSYWDTTGWDPLNNDVNGTNHFNMTPAQVAIQAGDVNELREIVNHPQFEPEKMGSLTVFFNICQERQPDRFKVLVDYFTNEFRKQHHFDSERKVFVRTQ